MIVRNFGITVRSLGINVGEIKSICGTLVINDNFNENFIWEPLTLM